MEIFYSNNIKGEQIFLSREESNHCVRVLRHRCGDNVRVSGGDGNLYNCTVTEDNPDAVQLKITSVEGGFGKHNYFLHIAIAPTKNNERFEWFLEKGTEVGLDEITPLLCDHSERKVLKHERGERVIIAAAKQSLKGTIPILHEMTASREFIARSAAFDGAKFIAYCDSELLDGKGETIARVPISKAIAEAMKSSDALRAMVLIGPEGDFSREEIVAAAKAGFIPVSLGESRFRTETAALVATMAHYLIPE